MPVAKLSNIATGARSRPWANAGPPKSGTAGTFAGEIGVGDLLVDTANGVVFVNEGTSASPYYTPLPNQSPLVQIGAEGFLGSTGKALADTATSVVLSPSGLTVLGDGVHEGDSGAVVQGAEANGQVPIRLTTSDAAGDLAGLFTPVVAGAGIYQPDTNQLGVIDCRLTNVTNILTRIVGVGFLGLAPVGTTDPVTGATTITTLVDDDLALLYMASTATDADRIIAAYNAGNGAATQDYSSLTDLNTGVNMAAAATYQRFRVEVDADGGVRMFVDKALVFTGAAATLDVDEELNAGVYVSPTTTTGVSIDVASALFTMYRA